MKNVYKSFTIWDHRDSTDVNKNPKMERDGKILVEFQEIGCHMIFDVKMDGKFTQKG